MGIVIVFSRWYILNTVMKLMTSSLNLSMQLMVRTVIIIGHSDEENSYVGMMSDILS
jgi:hypothetical protein